MIKKVTDISTSGVAVTAGHETTWLPWGTLRAAAQQDDRDLAATYGNLLAQALAVAARRKEVTVEIVNPVAAPHGYTCRVIDLAGEHVTCRVVAADWPESGNWQQARAEQARAAKMLADSGYTVHLGA